MTAPVATLDRPATAEPREASTALVVFQPREACGCLLRNVENLGHRPECRNTINPTPKGGVR